MRAIFFDVGGTLVQPWPSVGEIYARVAARHGLAVRPAAVETAFRSAWGQVPAVDGLKSSSRQWWRRLVSVVLPGATEELFDELFKEFERAEAWQLLPGVRETLTEVRRRRLHLGVISNWDERLRPLLANLGLADWDSMTISCEVGVEKPAREIFLRALRAAEVPAAEAWHVGDSAVEDVAGAEAAGLRAVLVQQPGELWPVVQRILSRYDSAGT
jgi:putative hydrolase of the HAD superfamily